MMMMMMAVRKNGGGLLRERKVEDTADCTEFRYNFGLWYDEVCSRPLREFKEELAGATTKKNIKI